MTTHDHFCHCTFRRGWSGRHCRHIIGDICYCPVVPLSFDCNHLIFELYLRQVPTSDVLCTSTVGSWLRQFGHNRGRFREIIICSLYLPRRQQSQPLFRRRILKGSFASSRYDVWMWSSQRIRDMLWVSALRSKRYYNKESVRRRENEGWWYY